MMFLRRPLLARFAIPLALAGLGLPAIAPAQTTAQTAPAQHLPTPVATRQVRTAPLAHPALWKVTKGATTIYLFGTVHALPADVVWLDGPLADAFEHSDTLVTEIIEKSPDEMRAIVTAKAMLPAGQNLRKMLTPRTRAAVEKALAANNLPATMLDGFRPWYAAVALSTVPLLKSGYDPANGVDATLSARAKALGRPHEALETAEYQLGLFDSLPMAAQKRYLNEVATGTGDIRKDLARMIAAWRTGNAVRLAQLMNEDESDPLLTKLLLTNRNVAWAKWIKARIEQPGHPSERVFIAVGAGHLAGKGSVQDQLKTLGLTAVRVQ